MNQNNSVVMQLLVKAKDIPDGFTVYKKTGECPFVLKHNLKLYTYGAKSDLSEVKSMDGCKFIIDGRGNVNIVGDESILRVDLSTNDFEESIDRLGAILEKITEKCVHIDCFTPQ